ncbi:MAG: hypothetical protein HUJ94_07755 [Bacteroidales bacterium]|nr:hypothetical protein [Bacteroidales bacterium]
MAGESLPWLPEIAETAENPEDRTTCAASGLKKRALRVKARTLREN